MYSGFLRKMPHHFATYIGMVQREMSKNIIVVGTV